MKPEVEHTLLPPVLLQDFRGPLAFEAFNISVFLFYYFPHTDSLNSDFAVSAKYVAREGKKVHGIY